jgi:hypothetical protein
VLRIALCVAGGAALYFAVLWALGLRYRDLRVAAAPAGSAAPPSPPSPPGPPNPPST